MNKFSIVGSRDIGGSFFLTSEKAQLQLVVDVLRLTHEGASINIFKGHIESAYNLLPVTLLTEVKKAITYLKELDREDIALVGIRNRLRKLNEYVSAVEEPSKEVSNPELNDIRIKHEKTTDINANGKVILSISGFAFHMATHQWERIKTWIAGSSQEEAVDWWALYWGFEYSHAVRTIDLIKVAIELGLIS